MTMTGVDTMLARSSQGITEKAPRPFDKGTPASTSVGKKLLSESTPAKNEWNHLTFGMCGHSSGSSAGEAGGKNMTAELSESLGDA